MNYNFTNPSKRINGGVHRPFRTKFLAGAFLFLLTLSAQFAVAQCATISLIPTSGAATAAQLVGVNTPIINITYNTTNATGANFSGLPTGVTGSLSGGKVTISGSPTVTGVFAWSVTVTPNCGGLQSTLRVGTITVPPVPTLSASTTDICGSGTSTLTITSGQLFGFAGWVWYEGGCAQGSPIGAGPSIDVTPATTTTYYVRREGALVTLPGCASITITVSTKKNWYLDADNDGYSTGEPIFTCSSPGQGYKTSVTGGNDCNDANASVNPGATEVCGNSIDDNCNGIIDENCCTGIIISVTTCKLIWEPAEGVTQAEIVVKLNKTCTSPVSTNWKLTNGTFSNPINNAIERLDFDPAENTITFAPGQTEKIIILPVKADGLVEDYEFVNIEFSNTVNATTENGRALIGSNDMYPCRSESSPSFAEGNNGNHTIEYIMTLNKPYPEAVSVAYRTADNTAIAGQDYVAKSGVLTFEPNQTSAAIQLEIIGDNEEETPQREGFFLILTEPNKLGCNGPEAYAAIFILDDDNGTPPPVVTQASSLRAASASATVTTKVQVNAWPNPVSSVLQVNIDAPANEKISLQLVNSQGQILKQIEAAQYNNRAAVNIPVANLASGNYRLLIKGKSVNMSKPIVIVK